jgi:hypothetical protein
MKKLKGFLEASAGRLLGYALIGCTFAGGIAGALLAGAGASAGVAFVTIMAGTYLGFVAGYTAVSRAPERMTGLPKASLRQDARAAALLPLQGAAEIVRLMRHAFNGAATRPKAVTPAPAPAPQPQPASPAPKP